MQIIVNMIVLEVKSTQLGIKEIIFGRSVCLCMYVRYSPSLQNAIACHIVKYPKPC